MKKFRSIIFCIVFGLALSGCSDHKASPEHPNVLLISIDTLRSDHLSCYGYGRQTSPNIDALAKQGIVFDRMTAVSSWTLPSHGSMLTGKYPPNHGLRDDGHQLNSKTLTLAEILNDNGYYSIGIASCVYVSDSFGFGRGFDVFDDTLYNGTAINPKADEVVDRFLKYAEKIGQQRYFAFLHFFDPHMPYEPPSPYNSKFGTHKYDGGLKPTNQSLAPYYAVGKQLPEDAIQYITDLYDGEIAYVDAQIGRLLERLKQIGLMKNTVVVITSDHGEEFEEHGGLSHGKTLYQEQLHVPLIFSGHHRFSGGLRRAELVSTCDIPPTILDLIGVKDLGIHEFDGVSLLATADDRERVVFAETIKLGHEKRAALYKDYKMIHRFEGDEKLYFDLKEDAHEQRLLSKDPTGGTLEAHLMAFNSNSDAGWHLKLIAKNPDIVWYKGMISSPSEFRDPRRYFSKYMSGSEIQINKFELNPDRNKIFFDIILKKGICEIVFDVTGDEKELAFNVEAFSPNEGANPAGAFLGPGVPITEKETITLSQDDPRLNGLPNDYENTQGGIYIRTVSAITDTSPKASLSDDAIKQLKTLGYIQ